MRDAEEDEETRVLSPREAVPALLQSDRPRSPGLPPPRIPRPHLMDAGDDEATKLNAPAGPARPPPWLISEGLKAPRELDHEQLTRELEAGKLSSNVFAWRDGMKQWQSIAEIPSLAGLLGKPAGHAAPATNPRASAPLLRLSAPAPAAEAPAEAGNVLLSSSVSTADFSGVDRAAASSEPPRARPAAASSRQESKPGPAPEQLTDSDAEAPAQEAERASPTPRPAAGRPPDPDEPVARADPQRVVAGPPAIVIAEEVAQGMRDPKISHREVTEPARSRLTLAQLRAGGHRPNVMLWVLGAGGWAVAGVLAGILIARGGEPAPHPAAAPESTRSSARADARPDSIKHPVPPVSEPTAAGLQQHRAQSEGEIMVAEQLPTATPTPILPPRQKATLSSSVGAARASTEPNPVAPAQAGAEAAAAPSAEDAINSPGF